MGEAAATAKVRFLQERFSEKTQKCTSEGPEFWERSQLELSSIKVIKRVLLCSVVLTIHYSIITGLEQPKYSL
jgi:hypothetical protein